MVLYGLEISTGALATGAHAAGAGTQTGGAIGMAAVPTPIWAAVRGGGEEKSPGAGAGLEKTL